MSEVEKQIRDYIADAKKYAYVAGVPWREVEKLLLEIDNERTQTQLKSAADLDKVASLSNN